MEIITEIAENNTITLAENAAVQCILYFDVFNYPLTKEELFENMNFKGRYTEIDTVVSRLVEMGIVTQTKGFIHLSSSSAEIIDKRIQYNENARKGMKKALRYSKLISKFPFVESVCISGSLSKGVLEPDGDVDYFIISKASRLWVCRSLLVGFKKIFLLNSRKYFCINYFLDATQLHIPDRNIFVATEIKYLLPVFNHELYLQFMKENEWSGDFITNKKNNEGDYCMVYRKGIGRKITEAILSGKLGDKLDNFFFKLTLKRWKKKFSHFNVNDFDLNMRTRKDVSKHHPRGYQLIVLNSLVQKTKDLEARFGISLSSGK